MIIPCASSYRVFRRLGPYTSFEGKVKAEVIVLDKDGDGGFFGTTKFYYENTKFMQGAGDDTSNIESCPFVFV